MINKITLCILKQRLKIYKKNADWYTSILGDYDNWYYEHGIPDLERQIQKLELDIIVDQVAKKVIK